MRRALIGILALVFLPAAIAGAPAQSAAAKVDVAAVMQRVGAAVERYFARAQSLICLETVNMQTLTADLSGDMSPMRRLTFELRIAWDAASEGVLDARTERQLLKVNNRAPGPKDKPGCLDPEAISPEPLAFLLPAKQPESLFTVNGTTKLNGRTALLVDYRARQIGPISSTVKDEDCWSIDPVGRQRGRIWVDAETSDVLRFDERLNGIFDVTLPATKNHRERFTVTVERLDSSTVYGPVTFSDPVETILLPKQIETLQVIRNSGTPRLRKRQVYSNYRRFMTSGRIVQD